MANDLYKGLSILYDMELNDYMMSKTIDKLNYEINIRGYSRHDIKAPVFAKARFEWSVFFMTLAACCGVSAVYYAIHYLITEETILGKIMMFLFGGPIVGIIIGAICGVFVAPIVCAVVYFYKKSKYTREYEKELSSYERIMDKDDARVQKELVQRDMFIEQRDMLIRKQNESRSRLNGFYNSLGIDRNYRNLIPIGYMYELCRLGVSNKLSGTDGLYYLVRKELRYDKLQYSLDEISSKLDTIISKQSDIYDEISSVNSKCDNLISQTKRSAELAAKNNQLVSNVVKNTSITNYQLQRTNAELEYQNTMKWITNRW